MKQNSIKGEWAGSSHLTEKYDELNKAHQEFKEMLANGWHIGNVKVKSKRPRIKKDRTPREVEVSIFGGKVRMTFAEYQQHGAGLKVLMKIF